MAPTMSKKRKIEDAMKGKVSRTVKRPRKQQKYDSSSSGDEASVQGDEFAAVDLQDTDEEARPVNGNIEVTGANSTILNQSSEPDAGSNNSTSEATDVSSESESSQPRSSTKRKRNDPEAFAVSMTKILGSKLSTSKRADPVLARSKTALAASQELSNSRLEAKAKHKLREEKKAELDKGRVRDVLGLDSAAVSADGAGTGGMTVGEIAEQEQRLRKTAQRGVVKLFNAVRAAQVKAEEAVREARKQGVVGAGRREEKATEMSKQGFLELIGGTSRKPRMLEEA
ncbi:MAG: hypothetical protein M1830_009966 [Pleopsidium flavum]|nr:MAG: hypothetical protein M1830_009966 [Pleopsidium flavum]